MKKLLALIVLALLGFYVAWPAYTGYTIHAALEAEDSDVLSRKIDFPQVRESIREPVMLRLDARLGEMLKDFGPALGISREQVKMDRIADIVTASLEDVVSPERLGDIYKRGGDFTGAVQAAVLRRIDDAGGLMELLDLGNGDDNQNADETDTQSGGLDFSNGLGGLLKSKSARKIFGQVAKQLGQSGGLSAESLFPKRKRSVTADSGDESFNFANVKRFGFAGPLAMELGMAADRDAAAADVTARMSFQNMDWKVTRLEPHF